MTRQRLPPVTPTDAPFANQSQSILDDLVALLGQSSLELLGPRTQWSAIRGGSPHGEKSCEKCIADHWNAPISVFRNDLEHSIFAEAPIFLAQTPSGVPKVDSAENSQILRVRVAGRRLQSVAAPYPGVWWGSLASSARGHGCCSGPSRQLHADVGDAPRRRSWGR